MERRSRASSVEGRRERSRGKDRRTQRRFASSSPELRREHVKPSGSHSPPIITDDDSFALPPSQRMRRTGSTSGAPISRRGSGGGRGNGGRRRASESALSSNNRQGRGRSSRLERAGKEPALSEENFLNRITMRSQDILDNTSRVAVNFFQRIGGRGERVRQRNEAEAERRASRAAIESSSSSSSLAPTPPRGFQGRYSGANSLKESNAEEQSPPGKVISNQRHHSSTTSTTPPPSDSKRHTGRPKEDLQLIVNGLDMTRSPLVAPSPRRQRGNARQRMNQRMNQRNKNHSDDDNFPTTSSSSSSSSSRTTRQRNPHSDPSKRSVRGGSDDDDDVGSGGGGGGTSGGRSSGGRFIRGGGGSEDDEIGGERSRVSHKKKNHRDQPDVSRRLHLGGSDDDDSITDGAVYSSKQRNSSSSSSSHQKRTKPISSQPRGRSPPTVLSDDPPDEGLYNAYNTNDINNEVTHGMNDDGINDDGNHESKSFVLPTEVWRDDLRTRSASTRAKRRTRSLSRNSRPAIEDPDGDSNKNDSNNNNNNNNNNNEEQEVLYGDLCNDIENSMVDDGNNSDKTVVVDEEEEEENSNDDEDGDEEDLNKSISLTGRRLRTVSEDDLIGTGNGNGADDSIVLAPASDIIAPSLSSTSTSSKSRSEVVSKKKGKNNACSTNQSQVSTHRNDDTSPSTSSSSASSSPSPPRRATTALEELSAKSNHQKTNKDKDNSNDSDNDGEEDNSDNEEEEEDSDESEGETPSSSFASYESTVSHWKGNVNDDRASNSWSEPPANVFQVRGPKYLQDKKKFPSAPSLFKTVGLDVLLFDEAPPAGRGRKKNNLHKDAFKLLKDRPDSYLHKHIQTKGKNAEFILALNFVMPWGSFVCYLSPPSDGDPQKQDPTSPLTGNEKMDKMISRICSGEERYCRDRLKLVPHIVKANWAIKKMVGNKPAIIGKVMKSCRSTMNSKTESKWLEVQLDSTMNRAARYLISSACNKGVVMDMGVVIQAETTAELPERILGCLRVHRLSGIMQSESFMDGRGGSADDSEVETSMDAPSSSSAAGANFTRSVSLSSSHVGDNSASSKYTRSMSLSSHVSGYEGEEEPRRKFGHSSGGGGGGVSSEDDDYDGAEDDNGNENFDQHDFNI